MLKLKIRYNENKTRVSMLCEGHASLAACTAMSFAMQNIFEYMVHEAVPDFKYEMIPKPAPEPSKFYVSYPITPETEVVTKLYRLAFDSFYETFPDEISID